MGSSFKQGPNSAKAWVLLEKPHCSVATFRSISSLTFFLSILWYLSSLTCQHLSVCIPKSPVGLLYWFNLGDLEFYLLHLLLETKPELKIKQRNKKLAVTSNHFFEHNIRLCSFSIRLSNYMSTILIKPANVLSVPIRAYKARKP